MGSEMCIRDRGYLQGPPARNATLAWPHLLCATGSTLRVFDLQLGSLAQSLKLAAPPAPRASSASASSSSSASAAASRSPCASVAASAGGCAR